MSTSAARSTLRIPTVESLRVDLKSAQARIAALTRALADRIPAVRIAVVQYNLEPSLHIARLLEEQGRVPVVRFARDAAGKITGVELAVVQTKDEQRASDGIARGKGARVAPARRC